MGKRDEGLTSIESIVGGARGVTSSMEVSAAGEAVAAVESKPPREQKAEVEPQDSVADEALRKWLETQGARLTFARDDDTGKMIARLTDPETGEVIRQVPPEELLNLARSIDRYLGLLVDRKS